MVDEAGRPETVVAAPVVGVDERTRRGDLGDEAGEDILGAVRDAGEAGAARGSARPHLDGDGDDRLAKRPAAPFAGFRTTNVALVHLELADELAPPRRDRGLGRTGRAAHVPSLAHPPRPPPAAGCAGKASGPAKASEVVETGGIVGEPDGELAGRLA